MEITNRGVNNAPLTQKTPIETATAAAGDSAAPSVAPSPSAYTPSPELVRLLEQVRAQPAIRVDRVQAAIERLHQGYYHTASSIAQTADAMVRAGD